MLEPIKYKITCDGCGKSEETSNTDKWLIIERVEKSFDFHSRDDSENEFVGHYCNIECLKKRISIEILDKTKKQIEETQKEWIKRAEG